MPPEAGTCHSPGPFIDPSTIEPLDAHVAPRGTQVFATGLAEIVAMSTAGPPPSESFFNFPPAKNPIDSPSGEKKGLIPPSVPKRAFPSVWSIARR
jgi:hypothetical protein